MTDEDDIIEEIDELVEDLEIRIAGAARRLGLEEREIAERVANELKARYA